MIRRIHKSRMHDLPSGSLCASLSANLTSDFCSVSVFLQKSAWVLSLLLMLAECRPALSQDANNQQVPSASAEWQFGYDLFQMLLEEQGLTVAGSFVPAFEDPEATVLVLVGDNSEINSQVRKALSIFVDSGGSLLIMSDGPLSTDLGAIQHSGVTASKSKYKYQGFSDCLQLSGELVSEDLEGVSKVVTNRATWFSPSRGTLDWYRLLSTPSDSVWPYSSRNRAIMSLGQSKVADSGRAIVVSDASMFTNGMLWHADNSVLAIRVGELLCESDKSKLVFAATGSFLPSFREQMALQNPPAIPEPTLERMLRLANVVTKEVEQSNVLNEVLRDRPRGMSIKRYYKVLLGVIAAAVLLLLAWLILRRGPLRSLFAVHRKMRPAYQLMDEAYGSRGDYRSAASYLAREFCLELTGSQHSRDWRQFWVNFKGNAQAALLTPKELKELGEVVDVACRGVQSRLSPADFQGFGRKIQRLRRRSIGNVSAAAEVTGNA